MTAHSVSDGTVAGAAAQIAFEVTGQVGTLLVVEGGCGHDHASGAETALETLGFKELFLNRVKVLACGEALDRGDRFAIGANSRIDAAVHGGAIDVHSASAAVTAVAALLNAEVSLLP